MEAEAKQQEADEQARQEAVERIEKLRDTLRKYRAEGASSAQSALAGPAVATHWRCSPVWCCRLACRLMYPLSASSPPAQEQMVAAFTVQSFTAFVGACLDHTLHTNPQPHIYLRV